jgi:cyclohexyl-isocyanide hydratase
VLIPVTPTTSFADCPKNLDLLFVPGGVNGTLQLMEDPVALQFLADQAPRSRYVASVCTGSLILGAAGLLKGYRATSHWMTIDALAELGATPVKERVVIDRNRITGGGVTAGMDFGLALVAIMRNRTYAEAVQLYLEYDPKPPFNAGSPDTAPRRVREFLDEMLGSVSMQAITVAKRARQRW